jgi:hypothetical protein
MKTQTMGIAALAVMFVFFFLFVFALGSWFASHPRPTREATPPPLSEADGEFLGIRAVRADGELPARDPYSSLWDTAPQSDVQLHAQQLAMPQLKSPSISSVLVRALSDGENIAWRLQWDDPQPDMNVDADRFCDSAAIQLPLTENAPFMMGAQDLRVQIVQWKALWQKDIDEHFQDVQDLHPNYWTDLYWFAEGTAPYRVPDSFADPRSREWLIGYSAGNPVSRLDRVEPVQELVAEGFGTLTAQRDSASTGRGVWRDGVWSVVIVRPLKTGDPDDYQFQPGRQHLAAFAIWEGSAENVGGRKHYSMWTQFEVE